jgi:hypothetical protein
VLEEASDEQRAAFNRPRPPPPKPRVATPPDRPAFAEPASVGGEADLTEVAPVPPPADPIAEGIDDALADVEVSEGQRSLSGFFGVVVPPEDLLVDADLDTLLEDPHEAASASSNGSASTSA